MHDIEFRKSLPRNFLEYTGIMNCDLLDERREVCGVVYVEAQSVGVCVCVCVCVCVF
jgi:hypothetical protein